MHQDMKIHCLPFGSLHDGKLSQMGGGRKVEPSKVLCLLYHSCLSVTYQLFFVEPMFSSVKTTYLNLRHIHKSPPTLSIYTHTHRVGYIPRTMVQQSNATTKSFYQWSQDATTKAEKYYRPT